MKNTKTLLPAMAFVLLMIFGVGFISTPGFAQAQCQDPAKPVAEVIIQPDGIIFVPMVSYALLEVTISRPDGTIYNKVFKSGSEPQVGLGEILGDGRLDCSYVYELRAIRDLNFKKREGDEVEIRYSQRPMVQNGGFTVYRGEIVVPGEPEPEEKKGVSFTTSQQGLSGAQDFVINDDLIVDGSACIGFDCVNGESFGFDTLRLKENNLRIKFDDTSTAASFPRNDWQLTANDSANGGASKFSIDDISGSRTPFTVEANARSHSLYVDDGGRIGIRTSTPSTEIHVIDGDTPTLRLQQDGSSGFAPQTWDVAGNETNFFIRDVTNGSQLPFRIRPDAPTSSIFIDVDGSIGFRNSSPDFPVHLSTDSSTNAVVVAEKASGATVKMGATSNQAQFGSISDHPLKIVTNNVTRMSVNSDNSLDMTSGASCTAAGVWTDASSRDLKENIRDLSTDEALETLNGLNPVKYNYKVEKDEEYLGFIAEDVPEMVAMKDRKHMTPMDVVAVLTKVVQEQHKLNKEQQQSIKEQKKIISDLNKRIADLEKESK
ncbi:MAG: tail fiber domain-containing protein [Candidatus Aminicenantes bacterium]|jgi:hypothetical protein